MDLLTHLLPGLAVLAGAGIYGGDLFATLVLRAALADVDDTTLTTTMGRIHRYGDQRMPALFATAALATITTLVLGLVRAQAPLAVAAAVALAALAGWLLVFLRINAPINRAFTNASADGHPLPNARALQHRWERVLPARLALQTIAMTALCTAIALS